MKFCLAQRFRSYRAIEGLGPERPDNHAAITEVHCRLELNVNAKIAWSKAGYGPAEFIGVLILPLCQALSACSLIFKADLQ